MSTGKWLTLAANLGVLLGLVVLIFEVRQNAALSRLTVEVNRAETAVTIEMGLTSTDVAEAWMVSVLAPETLTDAQLRMAETQLVMIMQQWDMLFSLEAEGLATRERVEMTIRNQAPFFFGSAFGKHWWRLEAVGWQDTRMFEIAGPIIDEVDPDFLETRYANLREPFQVPAPGPEMGPELIVEARAFMAAYELDLRQGDRSAIAARYAQPSAMIILDGEATLQSADALIQRYETDWTPPRSFQWDDLSYQTLGPERVAVTGRFRWGADAGVLTYSYFAVLRRQNGLLRIVLEDETRLGEPAP